MPSPLGARQDQQWRAISTEPSIDYTWFGPARIPIPYTVTFDLGQSMQPSSNVMFNGKPAFLMGQSMQMQCMGDENGTGGGIHSGINLGEVKPVKGSTSVKINGKAIIRNGDECTMNKENCKGKYLIAPMPASTPVPVEAPLKVTQRLAREHLCPDHPVEIEAIATPSGGTYEWSHSRNCQLVDASGKPAWTGKKLRLKVFDSSEYRAADTEVHITVTYTHPKGEVRSQRSYKINDDLSRDMKWKIITGQMVSAVSHDTPAPPPKMEFRDQPFALVVIAGTGPQPTRYFEEIQQACNLTFKVTHSVLVANSSQDCFGNALQAAGQETGQTIDPLAVETADAVLAGIRQKGEVYVVAYDNGTSVFAAALPLIIERTQNKPEQRLKIHYQGFKPEKVISPLQYKLGSIRNVRNIKDPAPAPSMTGMAVTVLTGIDTTSVQVQFSKWMSCQLNHSQNPRHNFFENYWGHVRTPSRGSGVPDTEHLRPSDPKKLAADIAVAKVLAQKAAKASNGFSVAGKGLAGAAANKPAQKKQVVIPCFMDGTGNNASSRSNIRLMYESLAFQKEEASNDTVIFPKYHAGPGSNRWDYLGAGTGNTIPWLGKDSLEIANDGYYDIVEQYVSLKSEGYQDFKIDIYGFSRGAAIANELAWIINDKGLQTQAGTTIVPPGGIKVRFLGLFDTVHSMDLPGRNSSKDWHDKTIAPIVENCVHAFAAHERRVYFLPSLLQRIAGTGPKIKEMIFPGVHSDIGGNWENNQDIMKVTRSWMAENAGNVGIEYLKLFVISEAEKEAIRNDEKRLEKGPIGFPRNTILDRETNLLSIPSTVDEYLESTPLNPYPPLMAVQILSRNIDAPFKEQPKTMYEDRFLPKDIPRFISNPR